jgi:hypothetical protein
MVHGTPGHSSYDPREGDTTARVSGSLSLLWFWRRAMLRVALTMALVGLAFFAAYTMLDAAFTPWMRSFGLWPTLTGNWHGELQTADGGISFVYFEIHGVRLRRGSHIYGSAKWCDGGGRIWDYELSGRPDNWRGTHFSLSTRSVVERESGVSPGELQGEWSGDEIRATGVMVSNARTATAHASRTERSPSWPPPVRYALRRGSEKSFLAACR